MVPKAWRMLMSFGIRYDIKGTHTNTRSASKYQICPFQWLTIISSGKLTFVNSDHVILVCFVLFFSLSLAVFIRRQLLPLLYRENNELRTYIAIGSLEKHDKFSARLKKQVHRMYRYYCMIKYRFDLKLIASSINTNNNGQMAIIFAFEATLFIAQFFFFSFFSLH